VPHPSFPRVRGLDLLHQHTRGNANLPIGWVPHPSFSRVRGLTCYIIAIPGNARCASPPWQHYRDGGSLRIPESGSLGEYSDESNPATALKKGAQKMSNSTKRMRVVRGVSKSLCTVLLLLICGSLSAQNEGRRVRNIVLVHGAWADGSGWKGVYDILVKDGYNVSIVQEPETSFQADVAATKRILALQDGPCILVAHSYGGSVITEAGTGPSVAGLVYVAAHMPDAGENEADDGKRFPSDVSKSTAIKTTPDGFTYIDPAQFHEYFAADVPAEQAALMARSQVLNAADNFKAVITTPAWKGKPSWMVVAGKDRMINPDLERWYATRARSHKVEVPGASHSVYVSRPKEVAAAIEEAATQAR
jgi:pimeloyl-ACP methyl ester carboxylesterase